MKTLVVPLPDAWAICEEIRQEGYGRDPIGQRLDCWACMQEPGAQGVFNPLRAASCRRVAERYKKMAAQGKIGWL